MGNESGALGEQYAAQRLASEGYEILACNYRCKYGEIDIICTDGDSLAFVEVKTRAQTALAAPAYAVTLSKRKKIILTATCFLMEREQTIQTELQPRFDVVEILTKSTKGFEVLCYHHIKGAFDSYGNV